MECLGELAVSSGQEDFLEYTREWMEKVNRGGLVPLNNTTFSLFVSIEKRVKILLPAHAVKGPSSEDQFKADVIDKIVQDDDVQWYWILLSQNIHAEDNATELLTEIVKLWVTIRGFSFSATLMELYKQKGTKKKLD